MLAVTINGQHQVLPEGLSILQALVRLGITVPSICHDERIRPAGDCRLCSVQVLGEARPTAACIRELAAGMSIETHGPQIEEFRRATLEMLAAHVSPDAAVACAEKEFHRLLTRYGVDPAATALARAPDAGAGQIDNSNPHIRVDMSQCILCYRCVRICDELQGQFVWHALGRGADSRVAFDRGERFADSSCVSCGACVDTCPTAALVDQVRLKAGPAETWTRTTCAYCGVGCELQVGVRAGRIVGVRPESDSPVSKGHLCVKGRYAWDFGAATDRVTRPLIRRAREWRASTWSEALSHAAGELRRVITDFGPDSVGVLGSARATNEENYLVQKFARLVVGTNNVDCCARVCHMPTAAAMKRMLGTGAATNSFDDIERARTILVAGANPSENHPIVGARIKQRILAGAKLIVIDPRRIELAEHAAIHLAPRPGTNIPLLNAMAQVIVGENLADPVFVRDRVAGLEQFREFVRAWTPERAASICGVEPEAIRAAARLYATGSPSMCFHGLGLTEHLQGTDGVMALVNLALLTGNIGKPGTGINPLRGQNNVQGAALMGCEPEGLTGGVAIADAAARFQDLWGGPIPARPGLNVVQMMDAAAAGRLKALYVAGYDVLLTLANTASARQALARLELVIIQDLFMNETAREFGTIFLPVASTFEKDGTFMNAERRIQRVRRALDPPADARADWQIVCELAGKMGAGDRFQYRSAGDIWDEVRRAWPAVSGISYARLESGGLQWPCRDEQDPGTQILHTDTFASRARAELACIDFVPTQEVATAQFPFLLTTGRNLYQFNAGTMTDRTPNHDQRPHDTLDISPADAGRLGISSGDRIRVASRHGAAALHARIDSRVKPLELFASFHEPKIFLNSVTSRTRDRIVGTPEYKVTAVRIEQDRDRNA